MAAVGSIGSGKMLQRDEVQVHKEGVCQGQAAGSRSCRAQLQRLIPEGGLCSAPSLTVQAERVPTVTSAGVRAECSRSRGSQQAAQHCAHRGLCCL